MTMYLCRVVCPWVAGIDRHDMAVALSHPSSWTDVTGQGPEQIVPDPNVLVAEGVVDQATLAALEADAEVVVLWSEVTDG